MAPDAPEHPNRADGLSLDDRLDSWKEIAAYLKRDVSTVQRWEKREGMPVRRHLHDKLGSVYASRKELDHWWQNRRLALEAPAVADTAAHEAVEVVGVRGSRRVGLSVVAVISLVLVGTWLVRSPLVGRDADLSFHERGWVLLTTFENRTGDARFDGMLEHALAHELSQSTYLNVVPRERIEDTLRLMARPASTIVNAEIGCEIALRDGAIGAVVAGRIDRAGDSYLLTAQLVHPRDGSIAASLQEAAHTDTALTSAVRRLSNWTRLALGERRTLVEQAPQSLQKVTTASLRALRLFSEGEAVARSAIVYAGRWAEAEALFAEAAAEDHSFASAHMWLAWARWHGSLWSGRPDTTEKHLEAARRAVALIDTATPRERAFIRGAHAWMTNELESAIGEFEALLRLYPDDFWGLTNLSRLYRYVGRAQAIVEMNARLAELRPKDARLRLRVAQDLLQGRGLEAARPHVAAAAQLLEDVSGKLGAPEPVRTYLLLFPVHEMWLQGRVHEAAAALDAIAARPEVVAEGVDGQQLLVSFYFTLGRLRRVEATWAQDQNQHPPIQKVQRAMVALARNEPQRVRDLLASYQGIDPAPVRYLIRAGELAAAAAVLDRLVPANPAGVEFAAAELEAVRGDPKRLEQLVWGVSPSARRSPWFMSLNTLARSYVARRDWLKAIEVLETAAALRERVFFSGAHAGGLWIQNQKLLANAYRHVGRTEAARRIDGELLALLATADNDHSLLVELGNQHK